MLVILAGVLPTSASFTSTEIGKAQFQKLVAWLIAFMLYKPAAAIVYATAFKLSGVNLFGDDGLISLVTGMMLMVLSERHQNSQIHDKSVMQHTTDDQRATRRAVPRRTTSTATRAHATPRDTVSAAPALTQPATPASRERRVRRLLRPHVPVLHRTKRSSDAAMVAASWLRSSMTCQRRRSAP